MRDLALAGLVDRQKLIAKKICRAAKHYARKRYHNERDRHDLLYSVDLARADVLSDYRRYRDRDRVHRNVYKALDIRGGGVTRDHDISVRVYSRLDKHV